MKTFKTDFDLLLSHLKSRENFAFTRFSDGEMLIMQNRKIVIDNNKAFVHDNWCNGSWGEEEHKTFLPEKDGALKEQLIETFKYKQEKYYKGICCICCVGQKNWEWQFELIEPDEKYLTWANLLINGNYPRFIEEMVPIFKNYDVVYVCNKAANLEKLPFKVKKDFRIGSNCHINDQHLIQEIEQWVLQNKTQNSLFLFSAASLSNLLIYNLYKKFPNNIYLDIGSTLNPLLDLDGWKGSRGYLRGYWLKQPDIYSNKECIW